MNQNEVIERLTPAQAAFMNSTKPYLWFCAGIASGKCVGKGTPILMFNGLIKQVEDIVIGDFLMGWDSKPRMVVELARGIDSMYEIKPLKGDNFIVNSNHILTIIHNNEFIDIPLQTYLLNKELHASSTLFRPSIEFDSTLTFGNKLITPSKQSRLYKLIEIINTFGCTDNDKIMIRLPTDVAIVKELIFLIRSLGLFPEIHDGFVVIDNNPNCTFEVNYIGKDNYYGFELDGPDGRFLLGDFTVTHNTFVGARYAYKRILTNPETKGLIAANTFDQLHSATLPPVIKYFNKMGLGWVINKKPPKSWGLDEDETFAHHHNIMTLENGACLFLRSLDKPEPIRGIEIGWAWIDEISSTDTVAWEILVGRLRDPKSHSREIRVTGTPYGDNWTWREFSKPNSDSHDIIFMSAQDNPFLEDDVIPRLRNTYDSIRFAQEVDGRIVVSQNTRIYYNWNKRIHMRDIVIYSPYKPLIFSWDFNIGERPMSTTISQEFEYADGTRCLQTIDEIIKPYGTVPSVCEEFKSRYYGHRGGVRVFGDSTGGSRAATVGENEYATISRYLKPSFENVTFHIDSINPKESDRRSSVNALFLNDAGLIRYFISPRCVSLVNDFDKVKPDKVGAIDKSNPLITHVSDSAGYAISKIISNHSKH